VLISLVNLDVALLDILCGLDSILLRSLYSWFLRLYELSHVFKHSRKFHYSLFDLGNFVATGEDGACSGIYLS
jgi:hypothetical protein